MKKIFLIFLLVFGVNSAFSKCSSGAIQFFPEQKEISLNPLFIIEGYASTQKIINSFKERKVYLETENGELTELILQEILTGQMQLTQAIFCSNVELKPNTTYFLKISDLTDQESKEMNPWGLKKLQNKNVYWKTTDIKSTLNLNSKLSLEFEKTEVIHYGCGPSANAIFNIKNKTNSEIWYKTEVVDLETNSSSTYYIKEWNGNLNVGHDMCSGAFTFKRKGKYKVRFTPMNIDGKGLKTTDWITFESPFVKD